MKDIKREMKNISHFWFSVSYVQILRAASHGQETENVCSSEYLLKNNQVPQFAKFMISSTSRTYVRNLSTPASWSLFEKTVHKRSC